jgi:hypothetical protein
VKKSPVERMHLNFQRFAGDLVGVCHREARRIPSDRCSSRGEDRLHARDAPVSRSAASSGVRPRRDPRALRPGVRRSP